LLPASALNEFIAADGSSFQARYHRSGLPFLEPLGTILIMQQVALRVKQNLRFETRFSHFLSRLLSIGCSLATVQGLLIKQQLMEMFRPRPISS